MRVARSTVLVGIVLAGWTFATEVADAQTGYVPNPGGFGSYTRRTVTPPAVRGYSRTVTRGGAVRVGGVGAAVGAAQFAVGVIGAAAAAIPGENRTDVPAWPPPASCARRYAGSWLVNYAGQTYTATINANGTGTAHCPFCMPSQRWTCRGNEYFLIDPVIITMRLSADGNSWTSANGTGRRIPAGQVQVQVASASPQVTTGASRWLPPGSPNREEAPAPAPRSPFGGPLQWGNPPVNDPGPRVVQPGRAGQLSENRRRDLDRLRSNRRAMQSYLARLPPRERRLAQAYLSTQTRTADLGAVATPRVEFELPGRRGSSLRECLRARFYNLPLPPGCTRVAGGTDTCTLGRGCTWTTCSAHLQHLQVSGPPRLTADQIVDRMNAVGCGGFRYDPRP